MIYVCAAPFLLWCIWTVIAVSMFIVALGVPLLASEPECVVHQLHLLPLIFFVSFMCFCPLLSFCEQNLREALQAYLLLVT